MKGNNQRSQTELLNWLTSWIHDFQSNFSFCRNKEIPESHATISCILIEVGKQKANHVKRSAKIHQVIKDAYRNGQTMSQVVASFNVNLEHRNQMFSCWGGRRRNRAGRFKRGSFQCLGCFIIGNWIQCLCGGGGGSVHTVGNDMFITLGSVSHTARCKYIHINVAVRVEEH